ncbi:MAG: hypothetical protein JRF61_16215 [Deltaproteobacteria bacterium]|nr:hypothetical protein [Deltaproteobacteria bacterium]
MSEEGFPRGRDPTRVRLLRKGQSWRLICGAVALLIIATGGFEAPFTLGQAEAAVDGLEAEEVIHEERRAQAGRRRIAEHPGSNLSESPQVADADIETALAAYASAQLERGTGRDRRYRHKSLLI